MYLIAFICVLLVSEVSAEAGIQQYESFARDMEKCFANLKLDESVTKHTITQAISKCSSDDECSGKLDETVTQMEKVVGGLDAAGGLIDGLNDFMKATGTAVSAIGAVAELVGPFLGAVGPLVTLVSMFAGDSETDQKIDKLTKSVDQGFARMETRFDNIENKIDTMMKAIEEQAFWSAIAKEIKTLNKVKSRFSLYHSAKTDAVRQEHQQSLAGLYQDLFDAIDVLRNEFYGNKTRDSDKLCARVTSFTSINRKYVRFVVGDIYNKMLKGSLRLLRISYMEGKEASEQMKDYLTHILKAIPMLIEECDEAIADRHWINQFGPDIDSAIPTSYTGCIWENGGGVDPTGFRGNKIWFRRRMR